jgi:hypothetical protein
VSTAAYFAATFLLGVAAGLCWERWMARKDRADQQTRLNAMRWERDEWRKTAEAQPLQQQRNATQRQAWWN